MPATPEEEYRRAVLRPIPGPYPALATEARKLVGHDKPDCFERYLTVREAAKRASVSCTSVSNLLRGNRVSEGTLLRVAKAFGGDAPRLLKLAGYSASLYRPLQKPAESDVSERLGADAGEREVAALYQSLSPERKALLSVIARALAAEEGA